MTPLATPRTEAEWDRWLKETAAYRHATVEAGHHRLVGHRLWCRCRVQANRVSMGHAWRTVAKIACTRRAVSRCQVEVAPG